MPGKNDRSCSDTPPQPEYGTAEYSEWYTRYIAPTLKPAKKSHKVRNSVLGTFAGIVAIVIISSVASSGGGDGQDKTASNPRATATAAHKSTTAAKAPAHKASPPAKAPAKKAAAPAKPAAPAVDMSDPVNEISITPGTCKVDPSTNWPQATVKVVNPTSDPSDFSATVVFSSLDGKTQYDTGYLLVDHVGHGVTTQQDVSGFSDVPSGATLKCTLTEQDRYAS